MAGRVVAGIEHDQVVAERLDETHRFAVFEGGVGEQRGKVVAGVGPPVLDDRVEHGEELHAQFRRGGDPILTGAPDVGVVECEQL